MKKHKITECLAAASILTCLFGHAAPVPLTGKMPVPLDQIRVRNPNVLPVTGQWKFKPDRGIMTPVGFRPAARTKIVTASSSKQGCQPEYALLGDFWRWAADNDRSAQWWKVDLGKPSLLSHLSLGWESERATYKYEIQGSADGSDWATLAVGSMPGAGGEVALTNAPARWMRINITPATTGRNNTRAGLRHVRIFITEDGVEHEWKLPGPTDAERQEWNAFTQNQFDDSSWDDMAVPSDWELSGFSKPTYNDPDDAVGLYRKWVDVPADFARKQILWHFDGVNNGAEIFINSQPVTYHESGFTAFDVDVTGFLLPGKKNLLALRVCKNTPSVDLDTGDFWCLGGIFRETYLLALPATHVQDITLVTDLDTNYHNATLRAALQIHGPPSASVSVEGQLFQVSGAPVGSVKLAAAGTTDANGTALLQLTAPVEAPALWSAEKPNLYYVVFTLNAAGQTTERVQERFGFRKIEIQDGVVLWNGRPIKCTGCCRHEIWPTLGKALNEEAWTTDLTLMKAANINAIRTSHYNFAQRFLELCDERGFYVLDEIPFCWCDVDDPALKPAFLQRARETLARDKNRPSVLAWSLGNENGAGANVKAVAEYVHATDPTRVQFCSEHGPRDCPGVDLSDHHYPSFQAMQKIDRDAVRTKIPAIITEEPHTYYTTEANDFDPGCRDLWGESLATVWNIVWPSKSILGSFIWEWQDQGIIDTSRLRGAAPDFKPALKDPVHKGIVDSYRNPRTDVWHVKMVYSPVMTGAREVEIADGQCAVIFTNRYDFTDLAELSCHWQALKDGKTLAEGKTHIDCPPESSVVAQFPATPGMDALRIEFIHPDGRNLYSALLRVKGMPLPSPWSALAGGGPLKLSDLPAEIQVSNDLMQLTVDKTTGLVQTWQVNGDTLVNGGPILNFGEGAPRDGDFLYNAQPPRLENPVVSATNEGNAVRINVSGDAFLGNSDQPVAQIAYSFLVAGDARIDFNWTLTWKSKNTNARELGVKFPLPGKLDRMTWLRNSQWTDYPPDHIGRATGTATSHDVAFRASHRNLQWLLMSGDKGDALALSDAGQPLQGRARVSGETTMLFASEIVTVPHELAWDLLPQYQIKLKADQIVTGAFRLAAVHAAPASN